jgi:hypothetical protein
MIAPDVANAIVPIILVGEMTYATPQQTKQKPNRIISKVKGVIFQGLLSGGASTYNLIEAKQSFN